MKHASGNATTVLGWLAYAVLALMLGLPLLDWLQHSGISLIWVMAVVAMCFGWLLRHPLALLGLWLGLSL